MGGAYPVKAYRSGERTSAGPGSQRPPYRPPPRPSNDNYPKPPTPANDNFPRSPARAAIYRTGLRGGLRIAARALPYVGLALTLYELYNLYRGRAGASVKLDGSWQQCGITCPESPDVVDNTGCVGICSLAEALPITFTSIQPGWTTFTEWHHNNPGAPSFLWRYRNVRSFTRTSTGTTERPHYAPHPYSDPFPQPYSPNPYGDPVYEPLPFEPPVPAFPPGLDPFSQPPFMPEGPPMPVPWRVAPYRVPNPFRNPQEQPRRGPSPRQRPESPLDRDPLAPPIHGQPGPTVELWPTPREGMPAPGSRPQRPPRRERERKLRATLPVVIRKGLNAATEACDGVEALWDALVTTEGKFDKRKWQKRLRYHAGKKKPTCQAKAMALYDLWDQLDGPEAVKNLVSNQIEDYLYGKLGQAQKKGASRNQADGIAPSTGRGYQSGPWDSAFRLF